MRQFVIRFTCLLLILTFAVRALARQVPAASPTQAADSSIALDTGATPILADDFSQRIDLSPLAAVEIQHMQTLKTMDSFARQTMSQITGRSHAANGEDALYTVLDMTFRPELYASQKIIKIKYVPLREDFQQLNLPDAQQEELVHDGLVSLAFLESDPVDKLLVDLQATAMQKADAIGQLSAQAETLAALGRDGWPLLRILPPSGDSAASSGGDWRIVADAAGTPEGVKTTALLSALRDAWRARDLPAAQKNINELAAFLPTINPALYPPQIKRSAEVIYNRLAMLTIPAAAIYFIAFVLFLLSTRTGVGALRLWGLRAMVLAWLVHAGGIALRWWLITTSVGNFFESIPIKNMFESVLMSAFFGVTVALILELRRSRGLFGAAGSFVGCLSLVAICAVPFVIGRDIGGPLGPPQGVLMSYWLYIHVVMVTASYSMISMGFLLSAWWLIRYYTDRHLLSGQSPAALSGDREDYFAAGALDSASAGGVVIAPSLSQTLARIIFLAPAAEQPAAPLRVAARATAAAESRSFLTTLDAANLVILQLAFWTLGTGVICGAIWADQSWGRPWGWDPKETFALVTWIVYLIVVHARVATHDKAWWTATLSVLGFFVMLFNWIGVNFFLVGLHSYA
jgi:cytochrome c-type biogenesis protein CcsB